MQSIDEHILKVSKEIIVKFIEIGRISPAAFPENFDLIYNTIKKTVKQEKEDIEE